MSNHPILQDTKAVFPTKPLSDCLVNVKVPIKVPRSSFLSEGTYPIISQESDFINGYWNNTEDAVQVDGPVVVFGDHTQVLKLIDFDFVVGADGVKILKPKDFLDAGFLRYFLEANPIKSLGYARHYRHISGIPIALPLMEEQKRIVAILDQAFAALDLARALAEANLADAREIRDSTLDSLIRDLLQPEWTIPLADAVHRECKLSYGIVQPGDDVDGGLPIVRPVDLKTRFISLDTLKRISPDHAAGYARTQLVGGELLLCVRGSTGEVSVASESLAGCNVTRGIVPIRFDATRVLPEFAFFQFRSSFVRDQISKKTYGAALMQINIKDLREIEFIVPPVAKQRRLIALAEQLFNGGYQLCEKYQAQLADIAILRQTLLQKAFSGQLT